MNNNIIKNLIKAVRITNKIPYDFQQYLIKYLNEIKNGLRTNDFIDEDILNSVILSFTNGNIVLDENETFDDRFLKIISDIKFMLPEGIETEDFESIKHSIIIGKNNLKKEFYSIFESRLDYDQIMNMISDDEELKIYESNIISYAINVSPYCINQGVLKREIISYMMGIKNSVGDINEYTNNKLIEAKKRCGIYPLDERTLALISDNARRAENLVKQLDNMEDKLKSYDERLKLSTALGIKSIDDKGKNAVSDLEKEIEDAKNAMIRRLDDYLIELEKSLKISSDQIFNSILKDTTESLKNIKVYAQSINTTTTEDLLRIKKAAEDSVDTLKNYIQNEPELRKIIEDAARSANVKEAYLASSNIPQNNDSRILRVDGVEAPSGPSIIIPGFDKQIIPENQRVIIPEGQINNKLIEAFDTSIPFEKRFEKIMKEKEKREKNGELFHSVIDEILIDVIEGDWIYLFGPSGCGKTYVFEQVASLLGIDYAENGPIININSVMAYTDPHGRFRATQAFIALLYGKLLSFDELDINQAETEVAIRVLYDEMRKTIDYPDKKRYVTFAETLTVPVNPNFRLIAAGNTTGDGENEIHNAREKMDEAIQQRLTFKPFTYDDRVEEKMFGKNKEWYKIFKSFRSACESYAKLQGYPAVPGMITTRDASDIIKALNHKSKSVDQIIREKFTQKKEEDYLAFILDQISKEYKVNNDVLIDSNTDANTVNAQDIAKNLVYRCKKPGF